MSAVDAMPIDPDGHAGRDREVFLEACLNWKWETLGGLRFEPLTNSCLSVDAASGKGSLFLIVSPVRNQDVQYRFSLSYQDTKPVPLKLGSPDFNRGGHRVYNLCDVQFLTDGKVTLYLIGEGAHGHTSFLVNRTLS